MTDLATYALAALLALAPPAQVRPAAPRWAETEDAIRARYASIAADIAAVSTSRLDVAALVGVAVHESALALDVDRGECERTHLGRCDGGRAVSIYQLQEADPARRALLRAVRREATTEALRRIRWSWHACQDLDSEFRLSAYAGGRCTSDGDAAVASRGLYAMITHALHVHD